jgi:small subunit ribosomal protein S11
MSETPVASAPASAPAAAPTKDATSSKKLKKTVPAGKIFIQATYNNTIVTVTDTKGGVLCWCSAGNVGFKGSRKNTPYAAQLAASRAIEKSSEYGLQQVDVYFRGPGSGKDAAVRAIQGSRLKIGIIRDITSAPHNGCRPRKRRRV